MVQFWADFQLSSGRALRVSAASVMERSAMDGPRGACNGNILRLLATTAAALLYCKYLTKGLSVEAYENFTHITNLSSKYCAELLRFRANSTGKRALL